MISNRDNSLHSEQTQSLRHNKGRGHNDPNPRTRPQQSEDEEGTIVQGIRVGIKTKVRRKSESLICFFWAVNLFDWHPLRQPRQHADRTTEQTSEQTKGRQRRADRQTGRPTERRTGLGLMKKRKRIDFFIRLHERKAMITAAESVYLIRFNLTLRKADRIYGD